MSAPPKWRTGRPMEFGFYVAFSDSAQRPNEQPSLYAWTINGWQHHYGWYDGAITHWIKLDLPYEDSNAE